MMPDTDVTPVAWDLLDRRAIKDLVSRDGADNVLGNLAEDSSTPEAQALSLKDLAIAGEIPALKEKTSIFKAWSEEHGLRRLSNILVELERVLELPARGQAILQAQALTRFILLHLQTDITALKRAISAATD